MIDYDFAPGVFAMWIALTVAAPTLYGLLFVDKYWKQHKAEKADDAFN